MFRILNIFLVLDSSTVLKSSMFLELVDFLQKHNQLEDVMIQQVRDITSVSSDWKLTAPQRINLYARCAAALSKDADYGNAFNVYFQAFKLINAQKASKNSDFKSDAEAMIVAALKSADTLRLEEVLVFEAIKDLKTSSNMYYDLLELTIQADMSKYSAELKKHKKLCEEHKIDELHMMEKKQYRTLCKLDLSAKDTFSFKEFASLLSLQADGMDEWVINAVTNGIIDAKID